MSPIRKKVFKKKDDLIELGLVKRLIRLSDDGKCVEYLNHGISRDWTKPEAIVEAKAYLTIGSSPCEADIEVYADAKGIGFDATDKPTKVNELDEICAEFAKFIKADDELEIGFYCAECVRSGWDVRELRRQMKSMLFHRNRDYSRGR